MIYHDIYELYDVDDNKVENEVEEDKHYAGIIKREPASPSQQINQLNQRVKRKKKKK